MDMSEPGVLFLACVVIETLATVVISRFLAGANGADRFDDEVDPTTEVVT